MQRACDKVKEAVANGAKVVSLPECFNAPYGTKYFAEYAEEIPGGETYQALKEAAIASNVFLIGGSIPERERDKLYNTLTVWSPKGELLARHRKMHLFDIDIPGKITFKENDPSPFCSQASSDASSTYFTDIFSSKLTPFGVL